MIVFKVKIQSVVDHPGVNPLCSTLRCARSWSRTLFSTAEPYQIPSIILASCKPNFRPGLQPGFRQVRACLRHAFDQLSTFLSKTWPRTCCINLDISQQVYARSRQMGCRKQPVLSKFAAGFRHAFDLLATRFSTRFAAARMMECGL